MAKRLLKMSSIIRTEGGLVIVKRRGQGPSPLSVIKQTWAIQKIQQLGLSYFIRFSATRPYATRLISVRTTVQKSTGKRLAQEGRKRVDG